MSTLFTTRALKVLPLNLGPNATPSEVANNMTNFRFVFNGRGYMGCRDFMSMFLNHELSSRISSRAWLLSRRTYSDWAQTQQMMNFASSNTASTYASRHFLIVLTILNRQWKTWRIACNGQKIIFQDHLSHVLDVVEDAEKAGPNLCRWLEINDWFDIMWPRILCLRNNGYETERVHVSTQELNQIVKLAVPRLGLQVRKRIAAMQQQPWHEAHSHQLIM